MKTLYLIPARGGSQRLKDKNIKLLDGKPLIEYTIDCARALAKDEDICVSTDSQKIIEAVEKAGLKVPFIRPSELATATANTDDVIKHAIEFYKSAGKSYDCIILLQPTSPLRTATHLKEALRLFSKNIDLVVSVKRTHTPAVLCQENNIGHLEFTFNNEGRRSQDFSNYYEYNGAVYIINVESIQNSSLHKMPKRIKYVMDDMSSFDIDNETDFYICEALLKQELNRILHLK